MRVWVPHVLCFVWCCRCNMLWSYSYFYSAIRLGQMSNASGRCQVPLFVERNPGRWLVLGFLFFNFNLNLKIDN